LKWQCAKGHTWEAQAKSVSSCEWCSICRNIEQALKRSLGIGYAKELAIENGGKCLSNEYKNQKTKLEWQCTEGHKFTSSTVNITQRIKKGKFWCSKCYQEQIKEK